MWLQVSILNATGLATNSRPRPGHLQVSNERVFPLTLPAIRIYDSPISAILKDKRRTLRIIKFAAGYGSLRADFYEEGILRIVTKEHFHVRVQT
jgi:hypothetical protein